MTPHVLVVAGPDRSDVSTRAFDGHAEVRCVRRIDEAIGVLAVGGVDAVVIDVGPADAVGATAQVRRRVADVPIVVVGDGDEADALAALAAGADDVVEESEAGDRLAPALERSRARRAAVARTGGRTISGALARSFVHDLMNPTQAVAGALGLVRRTLDEGGPPESIGPLLDMAERNVDRQRTLLAGLRGYVRALEPPGPAEPVDLAAAADAVLADLAGELEDAGAAVTVGPLPVVAGERDRVERLLAELVRNAIVHVDVDRAPEIDVLAERIGPAWELTVADNGPGMTAADVARCTEPFVRGDEAAGRPGVGLGLAIAAALADSLAGGLDVTAEPGGGTVVAVTLPAGPEAGR